MFLRNRIAKSSTPASGANTARTETLLDRRTLLRGAKGIALALPFLEAMRPRRAAAQTAPRRFVVFFTNNGYIKQAWVPKATGTTEADFSLAGTSLEPLTPWQKDIVVINGVGMKTIKVGPGAGHPKGTGQCLTARPLLDGGFVGGGNQAAGFASGISLDQEIARHIAGNTLYSSLHLGVLAARRDAAGFISYTGPGSPVPNENNPYQAWKNLFSDLAGDPQQIEILKAERRSVLDVVKADLGNLTTRVGQEDRRRLDKHLTSLRDLELRVNAIGTIKCTPPMLPEGIPHTQVDRAPQLLELQLDLMTMALACDLTRVATVMFGYGGGGSGTLRYTWLGQTAEHHGLSHNPLSNVNSTAQKVKINAFWSERFAGLVKRLAEARDADGPLLDSSLVLWTNELGNADIHSGEDLPYVLAGRLGGRVRTGRFVDHGKRKPSSNDLLLAIAQGFGLPLTSFGDPKFCTGPLPGVLG